MKKITDTQKYAILWLNHTDHNLTEIAKKIKVSEEQIKEILDSNQPKQSTGSQIKNLMITESMGQKHQVSIMTKAASEISDANRDKIKKNNCNQNCIYKPFKK